MTLHASILMPFFFMTNPLLVIWIKIPQHLVRKFNNFKKSRHNSLKLAWFQKFLYGYGGMKRCSLPWEVASPVTSLWNYFLGLFLVFIFPDRPTIYLNLAWYAATRRSQTEFHMSSDIWPAAYWANQIAIVHDLQSQSRALNPRRTVPNFDFPDTI